jgi:hypothetical protein
MDRPRRVPLVFEGTDIGFCGPAYEAPMLLQDAERCINWFLEVDKNPKAKMPYALLGAPGLDPILSTKTGPVRGAWVLPGNLTALFVTLDTVYLATVTVPATQNAIAQFSITAVGTLLTSRGRVVIRDNGVLFNGSGGYAVLVDGTFGYFYRLAGAGTVTFSGTLTGGFPTISFPPGNLVPTYLVVGTGTSLSDASAVLPAGTTITNVSFTANTITLNNNATATASTDNFTYSIPAFGQITDPAFLGADRVAFIEGWLIFNQPGTRTFYTNAPIPYTLGFAGAFYALKDSSTDNLITLYENNRELALFGERTMEWWYNAGGANFAFQRLPGIGPQVGCSAVHSVARCGNNLCWLAGNENGQNFIAITNQYSYERLSNHAVEKAIASYPLISDAIGDCYQELGHTMYVLTFPTADVTWVCDIQLWEDTQGAMGWWQRLSWDQSQGIYHRHLGNCFVNFANLRLWGDYQTGQIHRQDRKIYQDNGAPLRAQRRSPHVWSREDRKRIPQASLQVEFAPGIGNSVGQGSTPEAMIRWSDDGAQSWGNEHFVPVGKIGHTKNRCLIRRLGTVRDRVYEVTYTEPTPRDIIGATLFGESEDAQE